MEDFDVKYIKEFINKHENARVYLGVDSQKTRKKNVIFATVVVVHYNGKNGSKIFYNTQFEKIKEAKLSRPFNRMMKEVELVIDLYHKLEDVLIDREFEIHLDVNPNENEGSNVAYGAAKGYVQGIIGVMPVFKPYAFAST